MATVFFVRHGEVEGNSGERRTFAGWGDKPLTSRGEKQAAAVAARLKREPLAAVYASDLQRACRTGDKIAESHGLTARCLPELREVNYGAWEGLTEKEVADGWGLLWQKRVADPLNVAPPGGESYADLWERVHPAWRQISLRHPDESIVIVGHNGSLRVLLCHLLGTPLQFARRIHLSNCGLSRADIKRIDAGGESGISIMFVNEINHLEGI